MKIFKIVIILFIFLGTLVCYYLFRPLSSIPKPAEFQCMNIRDGKFHSFTPNPNLIFGMGLVYSQHIAETASDFKPNEPPPIFLKDKQTLTTDAANIKLPSSEELLDALIKFDPILNEKDLEEYKNDLPPLLDYEVELGFVLLEDVEELELEKENYIPKIGFFLANDISARSLAVFGEGQKNKAEYWGLSKSFPNFLPVSTQVWIPDKNIANGIPCIRIQSFVNGEERQNEVTANMIYTPKQMLQFISKKYKSIPLKKNDMVIMGTPGGVAMSTPRWMARFSDLIGLDRFQKLKAVLKKDRSKFLKPGDKVLIRGEGLGEVENTIVE